MSNSSGPRPRALTAALASACVVFGFSFAATDAFAQTAAYTSEPVDLYAGPSGDYPVVSEIGPNEPVSVMGCVGDYSWCDVVTEGLRGWVYGGYLIYPYQGGYVPLTNYGAAIGLPIVTFSLGAYWGSFYRDRPWYGEQQRWAHVPPPERGRPPPGAPAWHGPQGRPPGPPPREGGRPPGNYGERPQNGGPPPGAHGYGEAPRPPGNMPPNAGRPPANGEMQMQRGPANPPGTPPFGGGRSPGNANVPRAPEPQRAPEQARPAAPAPQMENRGPAPGGNHAPPAAPQGGMQRGPTPEQHGGGRPEPQGGHGGGGGHDPHQQ